MTRLYRFVFLVLVALACVLLAAIGQELHTIKEIQLEAAKPKLVEEVLNVVGKCDMAFDGIGATVGLIVENGGRQEIVHQSDAGFNLNEVGAPKHLLRVKFTDGTVKCTPLFIR